MGRGPDTFDGSTLSAWQVLVWANSYYELSTVFTSRIPAVLTEQPERAETAIASATNRILALELYLKALLIVKNVPVPKNHNLVILFNAVPEPLRQHIEQRYNEIIGALPPEMTKALQFFFGVGPKPDDDARAEAERQHMYPDGSLSGLLERNKSGFVESRYLFEKAKPEAGCFTYDHIRLAVLCSILCEGLELSMQGRQSGYKRHFKFEVGPLPTSRPDNSKQTNYRS